MLSQPNRRESVPPHRYPPCDDGPSYEEAIEELSKPLPASLLKVRPGATNKAKTKALVLAYYDWRVMANRLNRVVGRSHWYAQLLPWGDEKLICTLTILGVPKDSSGEARREGGKERENAGTSMEAQAKRRAMAEHGLNYLYFLPQVWGTYDAGNRRFVDDPVVLVAEMYRTARIPGLDLRPYLDAPSDHLVRPLAEIRARKTEIRAREVEKARRTVGAGQEDLFLSIRELCQRLSQVEPEASSPLDEARGLMLLHELREVSRALALP